MKVTGLNGRKYTWNIGGREPRLNDTKGRSRPHLQMRLLLRKLFPFDVRMEEVPLPGSGGLKADFVILSEKLMVEVHGRQHYEFVQHFHITPEGFREAQQRDANKRKWCDVNGIRYVECPDNESVEQWKRRITNADEDSGPG